MPSVFTGNPCHEELVARVRELKTFFYATYGDPSQQDFNVDQEIGDNPLSIQVVTKARDAYALLRSKFVNGSDAEKKELRAYETCLQEVASFIGAGWIMHLHPAVDILVDVVENGV